MDMSRSFIICFGGLSQSLIIATVTVDVWTLPRRSVGGIRWILCPPASFSNFFISFPDILNLIILDPEVSILVRYSASQPLLVANLQ